MRLLVAALIAAWLGVAGAQVPSGLTRVVNLANVTITGTTGATALPAPPSTGNARRLFCVRKATSGGALTTLKVIVQASPDDGATWQDFMAFVDTSATASNYLTYDADAGPYVVPSGASPIVDFTTTTTTNVSVVSLGAWSQLRVKYSVASGTGSFTVNCTLGG